MHCLTFDEICVLNIHVDLLNISMVMKADEKLMIINEAR